MNEDDQNGQHTEEQQPFDGSISELSKISKEELKQILAEYKKWF